MDDVMAKALGRPRFLVFLFCIFAGVAVVRASIGIYGVLSYSVRERAPEIGIRLALEHDRPPLSDSSLRVECYSRLAA